MIRLSPSGRVKPGTGFAPAQHCDIATGPGLSGAFFNLGGIYGKYSKEND